MKSRLPLLLLLLAAPLGAQELLRLPLVHRPADEVAALARALLPKDSILTVDGEALLMRAEPARQEELRELVRLLDRPQRRLRISIRRGPPERAAVTGTRVYSTAPRQPTEVQQVEVLEGRRAALSFGRSVPRGSQSIQSGPGGARIERKVEYAELETGFELRPRLDAEGVWLELRSFSAELAREGGGIVERSKVETTLRGPLGQWIPVAALGRPVADDPGLRSTRTNHNEEQQIAVKVEPIP